MNFFVSPELKAAAMRAAKADQRSLTSLVEKLLTDHCRATGYLPKDWQPGEIETPRRQEAKKKGKA